MGLGFILGAEIKNRTDQKRLLTYTNYSSTLTYFSILYHTIPYITLYIYNLICILLTMLTTGPRSSPTKPPLFQGTKSPGHPPPYSPDRLNVHHALHSWRHNPLVTRWWQHSLSGNCHSTNPSSHWTWVPFGFGKRFFLAKKKMALF